MTISQQFVGTPDFGLNPAACSPKVPNQCGPGSLLFLLVSSKDEDAAFTITPPSEWELLTTQTGGGQTNGEVRLTVWWCIPTTDISGQSVTVRIEDTPEDDNIAGVIVGYTKDSTDGSWVTPPKLDVAFDNTDGNVLAFSFDNQQLTTGQVSCVLVAASDGGGQRSFGEHTIPGCSVTDSSGLLGHPDPEDLLTTQNGQDTFFSTWAKTFSNTGGGASAGQTGILYQGDPEIGIKLYSKCGFDKSDLQSKLAGKEITDVKLRLRNLHSWFNTGLDPARIGYHNHSSQPSGNTNSSGTFNVLNYHWNKFETKEVDIPNSWGEAFRDGTRGGFTFGRTNAGGRSDYGYFEGSGSNRPRLRISWTQRVLVENPVSVFASSRRITSGTQNGNASYEVNSTEAMSGVAVQIVVETVADEDIFINDNFSTVQFFQGETVGFKEIQSLPGDQNVPGTDTIFSVEFPVGLEGVVATGSDTIHISELDVPPVDEFSVVFNDNINNPGYIITIDGLLAINQEYDLIDVLRRDLSGRYPDRRVRGMAEIVPTQNKMVVTDYEAPLNTELEYYVRLTQGTATFLYGPAIPTPLPFIPIQEDAYGEGLSYFKPIDLPELGIPVQIETLDSWTRPARILAEHQVLGRRNKVIVSDVRGGREGEVSGWILLSKGQTLELFESVINPGAVILIQNHNPVMSAYDDIYVQFQDVSFDRITKMVRYGRLDNPNHNDELVLRFSASFVEVDRPNPIGVVLVDNSWNVVNNTFDDFDSVRENRDTWLELLKRPNGPDESS